jgi:Cell division protein CrgA
VAPPKRKTGGRTTPSGTRPSDTNRSSGSTAVAHGDDASHHYESGRYTAPITKAQKESPPWVPVLMLGLLVLGALLIMLRYLVWDDTNLPMVLGMACLLGGLYTGTKWR